MPGFAIVAVVTLALGIGANGALFSVANAVLIKPRSVPHPERLVRSVTDNNGVSMNASPAMFRVWRTLTRYSRMFRRIDSISSISPEIFNPNRSGLLGSVRRFSGCSGRPFCAVECSLRRRTGLMVPQSQSCATRCGSVDSVATNQYLGVVSCSPAFRTPSLASSAPISTVSNSSSCRMCGLSLSKTPSVRPHLATSC